MRLVALGGGDAVDERDSGRYLRVVGVLAAGAEDVRLRCVVWTFEAVHN
jgi:hypothetical protein